MRANASVVCIQGIDSSDSTGAENTLLLVADVLATLAVSETGQRQLLYGETQDRWQRSRYDVWLTNYATYYSLDWAQFQN